MICAAQAIAQTTPEWIRYSAISPNGETIAFTYKGDIYRVPTAGGQAQRLTFHNAHDYKPVWSSDSKQLAFASNRYGNFDIYLMDALGGKSTRLTYHSTDEEPYTFSQNNTIIMFKGQRMDTAQHRQYPTRKQAELYSVEVEGGHVSQILTIPAEDVQVSGNGNQLIYHDNKGTENPWRKHHISSITRDIWTYDITSGKHQKITQFDGEDRTPIYTNNGESMVYLSEQSGSFNVHKLSFNRPSRNKQITSFNLHPVRFLSAANIKGKDILAFTYHGILYTMIEGEQPKKVDVSIRTQDVFNSENVASVDGDISEMDISFDGKQIAFISNGEVFVTSNDGAFTKQITATPERERFVSFSPDGEYLVYAAERDNKWNIYKATKERMQEPFFFAATLINESSLINDEFDNYLPAISPDGKSIAYIANRRSLKVMNLESAVSKTLVPSSEMIHMSDGDQSFQWSPDSQWIVFQHNKLLNNADIAIVKASGEDEKQILIPSGYYDSDPKWVNDGKQILWFSNRDGLKSYATSGRSEQDVYSLFLNQESWDKFNLTKDDYDLMLAIEELAKDAKEDESKDKDDGKNTAEDEDDKKPDSINIEWDGLEDRISRLTIHSSSLNDAVFNSESNKLYYLSKFEDKFDLWETDLRTRETRKAISLAAESGSLMWDPKMEALYLLDDKEGRISKLMIADGEKEDISIDEQVLIDEEALRQHSFDHVWLRTAKIFYEPSFHGINWQQMRNEYKPKVEHVANGFEFAELLSEMLGELNVSHSGASYSNQTDNPDDTASLGIFYRYDHSNKGLEITEIIDGGPLDKAKFDIKAGMLLTHIDGQAITTNMDWPKLLNRKADKFTLLSISDQNGNASQRITIKPISQEEETKLLYKRFVKINEREVLEKSKGKLGYVHIPGMADSPYRSMYDDMMGRFYDKKAMVVDTRFNGGGDLVADLAMFFTGDQFLTYAIEGKVVGSEPTSRYTKPIISLFNESMYSDGHCYASGYTDLKLGKSVGMPVPGTCSFAGWEPLPMGGYWGVVPVSAKNKAGEWLENNQTSPNILIKNEPGTIDFGQDQQLERAIQEILKDVAKS